MVQKAIVLVGGFGTRLRPLSCTRPKALFPVANAPLLERVVRALAEGDVEEVILAVNYQADLLEAKLGRGEKFNISIKYSKEKHPLGTAGPLWYAGDELRDSEPFFMLNGDIIAEVDYKKLLEFHREKGAMATIALHEVEDPSRYGVVELDSSNRILKFVEKPPKDEAPSNLINAGCYVLDPEVIDMVPEGKKTSIEREIFPKIAEKENLFGFKSEGIWIDLGLPGDYLCANRTMLERECKKARNFVIIDPTAKIGKTTKIRGPTIIGANCIIAENCDIGPYVAIGEDTVIGDGVNLENTVIFPRVEITNFSSIAHSIVGEGVFIGQWVKIQGSQENGQVVILGDYCEVTDKVTVTAGTSVCPFKCLDECVLTPQRIL
ncbi:MAG: sugar phosphate nucleotidyltransferase [Candidatus Hodarchaeota archaeon]